MNTRSLGFRLVTWYAGLLTLVFLVLAVLTLAYLRHYLEANLLDTQARRARQIADTLLASLTPDTEAALAKQVEDLYSPAANERFIRITRSDGRILYASPEPADGALLIATLRYPNGKSERRQHRTAYIVEVGASTQGTETTLSRVLIMLAVGLPVAVSAAVAGGFALVRRALTPVEQIARTAEDITHHNLRQRLPVMQTGDELERLSLSLNRMIERLEDAIQNSKRFVADASHELRTPLAVLRGELESLAQSSHLRPPVLETLGSMLEEVDRLTKIVEALLALSRLDAGEGLSERVQFNLADLAATTAEQMALLAEDKGITLVWEGTKGVAVEGDRARLKQVIVNLLDNAIKYTPAGGSVRLRVTDEDGHAILEVTDEGVGIPGDALPHVFERFYRVDNSRSRTEGGAGLGLSIVKSICTVHDARIDVTSLPGQGSHFRLTFPETSLRRSVQIGT